MPGGTAAATTANVQVRTKTAAAAAAAASLKPSMTNDDVLVLLPRPCGRSETLRGRYITATSGTSSSETALPPRVPSTDPTAYHLPAWYYNSLPRGRDPLQPMPGPHLPPDRPVSFYLLHVLSAPLSPSTWHAETVNVWTHGLPFFAQLYQMYCIFYWQRDTLFYAAPRLHASPLDAGVLIGACVCNSLVCGFSAASHLLYARSETWQAAMFALDRAGIALSAVSAGMALTWTGTALCSAPVRAMAVGAQCLLAVMAAVFLWVAGGASARKAGPGPRPAISCCGIAVAARAKSDDAMDCAAGPRAASVSDDTLAAEDNSSSSSFSSSSSSSSSSNTAVVPTAPTAPTASTASTSSIAASPSPSPTSLPCAFSPTPSPLRSYLARHPNAWYVVLCAIAVTSWGIASLSALFGGLLDHPASFPKFPGACQHMFWAAVCIAVGLGFFLVRVPERYLPAAAAGYCNLLGHSHHFWHIWVVVGTSHVVASISRLMDTCAVLTSSRGGGGSVVVE